VLAAIAFVLGLAVLIGVMTFALGFDLVAGVTSAVRTMFPLKPATEQATKVSQLYDIVFIFAAVIFIVVELLIVWTVVRYRRKPGDDELPPQTHGHNVAEIAWTVIPTIIVAFLFYVSWQTLNDIETVSDNPDVQVKAVAGQFQWSFVYLGEDGQTELFTQLLPAGEGGGMTVPVGRNVRVTLESRDVIHAFYVARFLYKLDVVPGRMNRFEFRLKEDEAGQTFGGQCAELCGSGHRAMVFEVHAVSGAEFDTWLQDQIDKAQQSPEPGGSAPPPEATIQLVASGIAFDKSAIEAPADKPFAIEFDNRDASVPHDVSIRDASGIVYNGQDVTGPAKVTDNVPPLKAGEYTFFCTFHGNMTGTLTVK
jgi:cytochrome c oxidase subunit 2